jgi:hypothetical protein
MPAFFYINIDVYYTSKLGKWVSLVLISWIKLEGVPVSTEDNLDKWRPFE